MVDISVMKAKIDSIEKAHDQELKNTMMIAKHAAAEFFKIQGRKNNELYNKDMNIAMTENLNL